jgi:hypothetical protein
VNEPVFIITCVVARLTFFLNPRNQKKAVLDLSRVSTELSFVARLSVPDHDMAAGIPG